MPNECNQPSEYVLDERNVYDLEYSGDYHDECHIGDIHAIQATYYRLARCPITERLPFCLTAFPFSFAEHRRVYRELREAQLNTDCIGTDDLNL